jgi:hypothetical protein
MEGGFWPGIPRAPLSLAEIVVFSLGGSLLRYELQEEPDEGAISAASKPFGSDGPKFEAMYRKFAEQMGPFFVEGPNHAGAAGGLGGHGCLSCHTSTARGPARINQSQ